MTERPGPAALFLASRSPRRRELLAQIGLTPRTLDVEVDESPLPAGEPPRDYVLRLARDKALAGRPRAPSGALVLAADTTVVLDGELLGKPRDPGEALRMLEALSGREHQVLSGVALACAAGCTSALSESRVRMRATTRAERESYVATGEPLDKAGAYAIQGRAAVFVEHLHGSYSGVMGLPVYETAQLLRAAGLDPLAGG